MELQVYLFIILFINIDSGICVNALRDNVNNNNENNILHKHHRYVRIFMKPLLHIKEEVNKELINSLIFKLRNDFITFLSDIKYLMDSSSREILFSFNEESFVNEKKISESYSKLINNWEEPYWMFDTINKTF
jgi:hypothetical protein